MKKPLLRDTQMPNPVSADTDSRETGSLAEIPIVLGRIELRDKALIFMKGSGFSDVYPGLIRTSWKLEEIIELWNEKNCTPEVCLEILHLHNISPFLSDEQKKVVHHQANYSHLTRGETAQLCKTTTNDFRNKLDQAIQIAMHKMFPKNLPPVNQIG